VFEKERASFIPYARRFDTNKYSVLSSVFGRPVEMHAYADRLVIRQDGVVVVDYAGVVSFDDLLITVDRPIPSSIFPMWKFLELSRSKLMALSSLCRSPLPER
jgi:hypothetical protein